MKQQLAEAHAKWKDFITNTTAYITHQRQAYTDYVNALTAQLAEAQVGLQHAKSAVEQAVETFQCDSDSSIGQPRSPSWDIAIESCQNVQDQLLEQERQQRVQLREQIRLKNRDRTPLPRRPVSADSSVGSSSKREPSQSPAPPRRRGATPAPNKSAFRSQSAPRSNSRVRFDAANSPRAVDDPYLEVKSEQEEPQQSRCQRFWAQEVPPPPPLAPLPPAPPPRETTPPLQPAKKSKGVEGRPRSLTRDGIAWGEAPVPASESDTQTAPARDRTQQQAASAKQAKARPSSIGPNHLRPFRAPTEASTAAAARLTTRTLPPPSQLLGGSVPGGQEDPT
jgi:hypothetical protein